MTIHSVFCDFALWSTVGGVPHIANAQSMKTRIFWFLVFLIMLVVFVVQLYAMIVKFLTFPTMVDTVIKFEAQPFPVVTVCNLNPYKYTEISSNVKYDRIKKLMEAYKEAATAYYLETAPSVLTDEWGLKSKWSTPYELDSTARDALIMEMAKLGEADKDAALYSFSEFISQCSFSSKECLENHFTRFIDPVYGACYSFNEASDSNNASFTSNRAGMRFGLKLLLTPKQFKSDTQGGGLDVLPTTKLAGARVSVHAQHSFPSLEGSAISVGVGYQTAISVILSKTKRMKSPYGKCVDREAESTDYYSDYCYSMETCFLGCKQRYNIEKCGCMHPRYRGPTSRLACKEDKLECIQKLKGNQADKANPNLGPMQECGCHPPCSEQTYSATTSLAKFPSNKYYVAADPTNTKAMGSCSPDTTIFSGGTSDNVSVARADACRKWYEENSLLLQIFFENLKFESYEEKEAYGISSFLNDLGGQAGLWLGLSIISVIEVGGLLFVLCMYCGGGRKQMTKPTEDQLNTDERIQDMNELKSDLDKMEEIDKKKEKDVDSD